MQFGKVPYNVNNVNINIYVTVSGTMEPNWH